MPSSSSANKPNVGSKLILSANLIPYPTDIVLYSILSESPLPVVNAPKLNSIGTFPTM